MGKRLKITVKEGEPCRVGQHIVTAKRHKRKARRIVIDLEMPEAAKSGVDTGGAAKQ